MPVLASSLNIYINLATQTKAALERMEEMRQLIGRRQGDGTPRSRARSIVLDTPTRNSTSVNIADLSRSIDMLVSDADKDLSRAASNQEALQRDLKQVAIQLKEV
jgi:CHAT domain-containing protein